MKRFEENSRPIFEGAKFMLLEMPMDDGIAGGEKKKGKGMSGGERSSQREPLAAKGEADNSGTFPGADEGKASECAVSSTLAKSPWFRRVRRCFPSVGDQECELWHPMPSSGWIGVRYLDRPRCFLSFSLHKYLSSWFVRGLEFDSSWSAFFHGILGTVKKRSIVSFEVFGGRVTWWSLGHAADVDGGSDHRLGDQPPPTVAAVS